MTGNANPRSLLRKCLVDKLIGLMQHDSRFWFELLQRRDSSHVIEMRMSTSDHLKLESMFVDRANDFIRIVPGVDT